MNPILAMLQKPQTNNLLSQISQIKNMVAGKNPDTMFSELYNNNPQFRQFVDANKGKSPEQIAQENGIDINLLK